MPAFRRQWERIVRLTGAKRSASMRAMRCSSGVSEASGGRECGDVWLDEDIGGNSLVG
jgi:hypothetical protein